MNAPVAQSHIAANVIFVPLNGGSVDERILASLRSLMAAVASPEFDSSVLISDGEDDEALVSRLPSAVIVHYAPPLHRYRFLFRGLASRWGAPLVALLDAEDQELADSALESGFMVAIKADELSDHRSSSSQQLVSLIRISAQRSPLTSGIGAHLKALRLARGIPREDVCQSLWRERGIYMSVNELTEIEDLPCEISNPSWVQISETMQLLGRWVSWQYGKFGELPQAPGAELCTCEPCQERSRKLERAHRQREYFAEKNKTRRFSYED